MTDIYLLLALPAQVLHALRGLKGSSMKEGKRGERMSGSNKIIFDQLTEDSVKLMDNGDYSYES